MHKYLHIHSSGVQRIIFFSLIFILASHVASCIWLIQARVHNDKAGDFENTWIENFQKDFKMHDDFHEFVISLYWTIQTITTVGYGDVGLENDFERMAAAFVMVSGVILFSVANASLMAIAYDLMDSGEYSDKIDELTVLTKETDIKKELNLRVSK